MISIIPYSKNAVLVQWDGPIRKDTISKVNAFNKKIQQGEIASVTETIPAFTSITVCYGDSNFIKIKSELEKLYRQLHLKESSTHQRQWKLPMLPLLLLEESTSKHLSISSEEFLESFLSIEFTIGMKGFLPGFLYLAGLPETMHIPRKSTPDRSIPKGSIAIGGAQCGIYPSESPGGWHVIGSCPIPLIDLENEELSAFQVGDVIQFYAIDNVKNVLYSTTNWTLDKITQEFSEL